jgi:hypothetical protein
MVKTMIEQSTDQYIVKSQLQYPETINEREYKAISDGLIEGLIPLRTEKSKAEVVLQSTLIGMVSLESYLNRVVSKSMFLDVVNQLIRIIRECENNLLNIGNLLLDCRYIFLDPETKKVNCIFWPIINNQHSYVWSEFFQDLPYHAVFSKDENHDYVAQYVNYFKHSIPLSINRFERLIGAIKENRPDSTLLGDLRPILTEGNPADGLKQALYCRNCGNEFWEAANFCAACGSSLVDGETSKVKYLDISEVLGIGGNQSTSDTAVLATKESDSGTTVLGADAVEEPAFPFLIREKTQEKIFVDKPSFRIGKEAQHCNYVVSYNNAVSRNHADIITRDQRYYIIDNHSTNKTYVENRAIPANKEIEIFSGTKLRLANEEFVFYL